MLAFKRLSLRPLRPLAKRAREKCWNSFMEFEFDPNKNVVNKEKHGIAA